MSQKTKQWGAIIVMIALFAMIAFVTNLCNPMAVIVKNQFGASNFLSQIGNYGNFGAYLIMGLPSGMLIKKFGYKKTALMALVVGIVGILIQWASGSMGFLVYLIGALISGACMCMLNTVVNPMLNLLGGGGNEGNQLIQIGGVFNSAAAVACYIIMGSLIGEATKAKISDATPALLIALAIFVIAFVVIWFTKIEEPEQASEKEGQIELVVGACKHRHFTLGVLAIALYGAIEVGPPAYIIQYLTAAKDAATPGLGLDAAFCGTLGALYFLAMLVGRLLGGIFGGMISSRAMITFVSGMAAILLLVGIFLDPSWTVNIPSVKDWAQVFTSNGWAWGDVPVGVVLFLLVGLCASVMWGGIFNLATEGLGKYTSIASGIFMAAVCGFAISVAIQGWVADLTGSFLLSFLVPFAAAVYLVFYALIGSRVTKRSE